MSLTVEELNQGMHSAAEALHTCRKAGALVLRVHDGYRWHLYLRNAQGVPDELKFRLLELEPFALVLLKNLALGVKSLPI